jgi:hypothetical protein
MAHPEVGREKMQRLLKELEDVAQVEMPPRMEANILLALLAPKKGATKRSASSAQPAGAAQEQTPA